jgi:hypothetical protein
VSKKLKEQLKAVFDAPEPKRKSAFLQSLNYPKTSRFDFILGQIGYIRKRVWVISCLLVILAIFGLRYAPADNDFSFIWVISSVLPFISLVTVTEIARSASYNMAELEMSCKYNFAGVVLARLGILGFFNMLVFATVIILLHGESGFGVFRAGVYLLVPFMLTCSLSLFTLNRLRSRETIYICGGISCFTGIANTLFIQLNQVYSDEYLMMWIFALGILAVFTVMESIKLVRKTEELQWNL